MGSYLCDWCGQEFVRKGREHFCSDECRRERVRINDARRRGRVTAAIKKPPTLTERAVEARKLGISYGQLMARKEGTQ